MEDRRFTEVDLRSMLDRARSLVPDADPDRWLVETRFRRRQWHVILEPEIDFKIVVVVTAYPVE